MQENPCDMTLYGLVPAQIAVISCVGSDISVATIIGGDVSNCCRVSSTNTTPDLGWSKRQLRVSHCPGRHEAMIITWIKECTKAPRCSWVWSTVNHDGGGALTVACIQTETPVLGWRFWLFVIIILCLIGHAPFFLDEPPFKLISIIHDPCTQSVSSFSGCGSRSSEIPSYHCTTSMPWTLSMAWLAKR